MAEQRRRIVITCAVCDERLALDLRVPVAAAELTTFIDAHSRHQDMKMDILLTAAPEPNPDDAESPTT